MQGGGGLGSMPQLHWSDIPQRSLARNTFTVINPTEPTKAFDEFFARPTATIPMGATQSAQAHMAMWDLEMTRWRGVGAAMKDLDRERVGGTQPGGSAPSLPDATRPQLYCGMKLKVAPSLARYARKGGIPRAWGGDERCGLARDFPPPRRLCLATVGVSALRLSPSAGRQWRF